MFSEFPHSPCRFMARPLKLAAALFPGDQIAVSESFLNIRNIFRVAFLSCSHIRLEMCSGSLQGRSPFCLCRSVLFCATTFAMLSPNRGFVNNIFHFSFRIFFQKLAVQCNLSAQDPAGNLLLSSRCFSAATCILTLPKRLCKHFFQVFNFRINHF